MTKTDISFISDGFTVSLFPNTKAGEEVWNTIDKELPGCRFPISMFPSIKLQIKEAGYTIRKQRKSKMTTEQILAEIEDM